MNKKTYILIAIIIIVVGVMGFFGYKKFEKSLISYGPTTLINRTVLTNSTSSAISWTYYENRTLGFSIWIPDKTAGSYGYLPISIMEDLENSIVYFTPSLDNPSGFQIATAIADSDQKIQDFIQKQFGSTCTISKEYLYDFNNYPIYKIIVRSQSSDVDPNCFVNYKYEVLFYQKTNRLAVIKLGQECQFGITGDGGYVGSLNIGAVCLDDAITSGFRFED